MKISASFFLACMTHLSANAADVDSGDMHLAPPAVGRYTSRAALLASPSEDRRPMGSSRQPERLGRVPDAPLHASPFALAIGRAAKKGQIEQAVEAYTEVLIQCQKEQSAVLTTALLRSDSQQAHCFRF